MVPWKEVGPNCEIEEHNEKTSSESGPNRENQGGEPQETQIHEENEQVDTEAKRQEKTPTWLQDYDTSYFAMSAKSHVEDLPQTVEETRKEPDAAQ